MTNETNESIAKSEQKQPNRRITGKAFQSKARAHASFIFEQRKRGATWQSIVDELAKRDCIITISALRKWSIRYINKPLPSDQMALLEKEALKLSKSSQDTPVTPFSNFPASSDLLTQSQSEQTPWSVITPK